MSTYYTINDLKVRVSDHLPNDSMNKFRGSNDIEIYTHNLSGKALDVVAQVERAAAKHELSIDEFNEVIANHAFVSDYNAPEFCATEEDAINEAKMSASHGELLSDSLYHVTRETKKCYCGECLAFSAYFTTPFGGASIGSTVGVCERCADEL